VGAAGTVRHPHVVNCTMATATRPPKRFKVHRDPPVLQAWDDGSVRVGGTRVRLETVITAYRHGEPPAEIAANYGGLPPATVHAVLAYYLAHQQEVDEYVDRLPDAATAQRMAADTARVAAVLASPRGP
jgi:uncharacterized protein (DUF433 family)